MSATHLLVPVVACSALVAIGSIAEAGAQTPTVAGSRGSATLSELAGGEVTFAAQRPVERKSWEFIMPPGVQQGPNTWYMIRLDVSATFTEDSGPGSVLISGSTNGRAAAQVEFYSERRNGRQVVSWDSADLIRGSSGGRFPDRGGLVKYRNYLQFGGVQAGRNLLTIDIERFGQARIADIRIGHASGVYATPAGPVQLEVDGEFSGDGLAVGESGELEVRVSNRSPRIAKDVELSIQPASGELFTETSTVRRIKRLDGAATRRFVVGRTRPGELRLQLVAADAEGNEASSSVSVEVGAGEDGLSRLWWLALIVLGGGAAVVWIRRNRRETRS